MAPDVGKPPKSWLICQHKMLRRVEIHALWRIKCLKTQVIYDAGLSEALILSPAASPWQSCWLACPAAPSSSSPGLPLLLSSLSVSLSVGGSSRFIRLRLGVHCTQTNERAPPFVGLHREPCCLQNKNHETCLVRCLSHLTHRR